MSSTFKKVPNLSSFLDTLFELDPSNQLGTEPPPGASLVDIRYPDAIDPDEVLTKRVDSLFQLACFPGVLFRGVNTKQELVDIGSVLITNGAGYLFVCGKTVPHVFREHLNPAKSWGQRQLVYPNLNAPQMAGTSSFEGALTKTSGDVLPGFDVRKAAAFSNGETGGLRIYAMYTFADHGFGYSPAVVANDRRQAGSRGYEATTVQTEVESHNRANGKFVGFLSNELVWANTRHLLLSQHDALVSQAPKKVQKFLSRAIRIEAEVEPFDCSVQVGVVFELGNEIVGSSANVVVRRAGMLYGAPVVSTSSQRILGGTSFNMFDGLFATNGNFQSSVIDECVSKCCLLSAQFSLNDLSTRVGVSEDAPPHSDLPHSDIIGRYIDVVSNGVNTASKAEELTLSSPKASDYVDGAGLKKRIGSMGAIDVIAERPGIAYLLASTGFREDVFHGYVYPVMDKFRRVYARAEDFAKKS